jgi:putative transcriptional regulator
MLNLNNHFLIAMPGMVDDDFERAVVFIFDHGKNGAAGLVINRPSESTIKHMFDRMDIPLRREDIHQTRVFNGGPVYTERGFVLHEAQQTFEVGQDGYQSETQASFYASTLTVPGGLEMTTSHDVLDALSSGAGPRKIFIALGYAAWQAGQLEEELMRNDWLTVPASHELIFDVPAIDRYPAALALLGIDEVMLSSTAGNAYLA